MFHKIITTGLCITSILHLSILPARAVEINQPLLPLKEDCDITNVLGAIECSSEGLKSTVGMQEVQKVQLKEDCACTEGVLKLQNLDGDSSYRVLLVGDFTQVEYTLMSVEGDLDLYWNSSDLSKKCKLREIVLLREPSTAILGGEDKAAPEETPELPNKESQQSSIGLPFLGSLAGLGGILGFVLSSDGDGGVITADAPPLSNPPIEPQDPMDPDKPVEEIPENNSGLLLGITILFALFKLNKR